MAAHAEVDESLRLMRDQTRRVREELASLPAEAWDAPSNCPPWPVRRLVAHLVENARFIQENVEKGLRGDAPGPAIAPEARAERVQALADAPPAEKLATLDRYTDDLVALLDGLSAGQLDAGCWHPVGQRSPQWYARQRVSEIAFHRWDVLHSVGRTTPLDPSVAAALLPAMMEVNLAATFARGPKHPGRFRVVTEGTPSQSWLLEATPDELRVTPNGSGDAELTLTGPAGVLLLVLYGRADATAEEQAGRLRLEGDRAALERLPRMG